MLQQVLSVNVSVAKPHDAGLGIASNTFTKQSITGAIAVETTGLAGDQPANPNAQGSLSKAIYAYPKEHYAHWQTMRAQASVAPWGAPLPLGAMGENLTIEGLLENDVWIGDLLRFPNCQLAVSEPGMPDAAFNAAMGFAHAEKMMVQSGWCGFYLAVRVPGTIEAGDRFDILPGPRHVGIAERFAGVANRHRGRRR
jgi:MOSC domain-containing protein YiiM